MPTDAPNLCVIFNILNVNYTILGKFYLTNKLYLKLIFKQI
jgi:hypothetical protein